MYHYKTNVHYQQQKSVCNPKKIVRNAVLFTDYLPTKIRR